jgi:hypothetical protein
LNHFTVPVAMIFLHGVCALRTPRMLVRQRLRALDTLSSSGCARPEDHPAYSKNVRSPQHDRAAHCVRRFRPQPGGASMSVIRNVTVPVGRGSTPGPTTRGSSPTPNRPRSGTTAAPRPSIRSRPRHSDGAKLAAACARLQAPTRSNPPAGTCDRHEPIRRLVAPRGARGAALSNGPPILAAASGRPASPKWPPHRVRAHQHLPLRRPRTRRGGMGADGQPKSTPSVGR